MIVKSSFERKFNLSLQLILEREEEADRLFALFNYTPFARLFDKWFGLGKSDSIRETIKESLGKFPNFEKYHYNLSHERVLEG